MIDMILLSLGMALVSMGLQVAFYMATAYCVTLAVRKAWKGK